MTAAFAEYESYLDEEAREYVGGPQQWDDEEPDVFELVEDYFDEDLTEGLYYESEAERLHEEGL